MQRTLVVVFLVLLLSLPLVAQKAQVFGGYQYTRLDGGVNMNGWNGSLTGNLNKWFGVSGDFSGVYKSGVHFHTYTFGPVLTAHTPMLQPFVHALVGGGTFSGGGASTTGLIVYAGGGLDVGSKHGFGIRIAQADWMLTRFSGFTDKNNVRVSAGIVLKF